MRGQQLPLLHLIQAFEMIKPLLLLGHDPVIPDGIDCFGVDLLYLTKVAPQP